MHNIADTVVSEALNVPTDYPDRVDERIEEWVNTFIVDQGRLNRQMDERALEIFLAGSKGLRPIYMYDWTKGLDSGVPEEELEDGGAGLQYHHNTSLLLDDVNDNDNSRRGVTAFHHSGFMDSFPGLSRDLTENQVVKFMALPYAMIVRSDRIQEEHKQPIVESLASNVGLLANGQIEDLTGPDRLQFEGGEVRVVYGDEEIDGFEWWKNMADKKSGSLFQGGAEIASVMAGYEGDEPVEHGYHIGLLLQLTDDILDYTQNEDVLGKDELSDIVEGKLNYVTISLLERAEGKDLERISRVLDSDDAGYEEALEVRDLAEDYGAVDEARQAAYSLAENADDILDGVDINDRWRQDLEKISEVLVEREY